MEASVEVPSFPPLGSKSGGPYPLAPGVEVLSGGGVTLALQGFPKHGQGKLWWPEKPAGRSPRGLAVAGWSREQENVHFKGLWALPNRPVTPLIL